MRPGRGPQPLPGRPASVTATLSALDCVGGNKRGVPPPGARALVERRVLSRTSLQILLYHAVIQ